MDRIAHACEQGIGTHEQIVLADGLLAQVRAMIGEAPHRRFVRQESQTGGITSVVSALRHLNGTHAEELYCVAADASVSTRSLRLLRAKLRSSGAAMVLLTRRPEEADADCDIVVPSRGVQGSEVLAVVSRPAIAVLRPGQVITLGTHGGQHLGYTREQLLAIRDATSGAYGWQLGPLRKYIRRLAHVNGEGCHIGDLIAVLRKHGFMVRAFPADEADRSTQVDAQETLGRAARACYELISVARRQNVSV
jgi:bifunctional N-acetylglucosamine-1-phosphate-uridyltransferase/glucosamine-1-phosphate-acetyltransferase GlmU-like protein